MIKDKNVLTLERIRKSCFKLAGLLNVQEPNDTLINWIHQKYSHVTPATFSSCCEQLMSKPFYKFPGSGDWQYSMNLAIEDYNKRMKAYAIKNYHIPENDRPTDEDWKVFHQKMREAGQNMDVDNKLKSFDSDFINSKIEMKKQVERMKKLRKEKDNI